MNLAGKLFLFFFLFFAYSHMQAQTANYTINIPSIFTPNGDGINDSLFITHTNINSYTWSIYNRYGRIIIELDNITLKKWNGNNTIGDQPTDEGFYYYTLNAITTNNETISRNGWLYIIR
jgi:gliding motility-associated-like protein